MKKTFIIAMLLNLSVGNALALATDPSAVDSANAGNVVVIVGTRSARPIKDSPVNVRVIDRQEIELAGDTTAAEAVTRVAGVVIKTDVRTGQTPQIQGFESKHVLVLIDGRPANGRLIDDFDLARIPASAIERIEVLKGSSSVLYGSGAIGGVINIITRQGRRGDGGTNAGFRLQRDSLHRNQSQLSLSASHPRAAAHLDINHQTAKPYDLNPKEVATTGNGYERNNVQLNLEFAANENLDLSTTLNGDEVMTHGVSLGAANSIIDLRTKSIGRSGYLEAKYLLYDRAELRMGLGESWRVYELRDDQRGGTAADREVNSKENVRDASVVGSLAYWDAQKTTLGFEGSAQSLRHNQFESDLKERQRKSAFFQHEWQALPALALVPGVRYDSDSQFDEHVSKALAVRLDPTSSTTVRVSYGEGYRAPSFSELYFNFSNAARGYRVEGNEDLMPERSRSYQVSGSWQPNPNLWISSGLFDNRVKDLIITQRTGLMPNLIVRYDNIESARNRGVESSARIRVANRWLLGADYMLLHARDEQRGRQLDGRAMHSGALQARYDAASSGFNAAFAMNLVGRRPHYTQNGANVITQWSKPYRAAHFRFAQEFGKRFELFVGIRNLTNEGQEDYNPVPPRSYFSGVGAEL